MFVFAEVGELKFHRYSQEKTMIWLQKKVFSLLNVSCVSMLFQFYTMETFLLQVERTVVALKNKGISVGEGVKSTTYVRVKLESDYQEGKPAF